VDADTRSDQRVTFDRFLQQVCPLLDLEIPAIFPLYFLRYAAFKIREVSLYFPFGKAVEAYEKVASGQGEGKQVLTFS